MYLFSSCSLLASYTLTCSLFPFFFINKASGLTAVPKNSYPLFPPFIVKMDSYTLKNLAQYPRAILTDTGVVVKSQSWDASNRLLQTYGNSEDTIYDTRPREYNYRVSGNGKKSAADLETLYGDNDNSSSSSTNVSGLLGSQSSAPDAGLLQHANTSLPPPASSSSLTSAFSCLTTCCTSSDMDYSISSTEGHTIYTVHQDPQRESIGYTRSNEGLPPYRTLIRSTVQRRPSPKKTTPHNRVFKTQEFYFFSRHNPKPQLPKPQRKKKKKQVPNGNHQPVQREGESQKTVPRKMPPDTQGNKLGYRHHIHGVPAARHRYSEDTRFRQVRYRGLCLG